VDAPAPTREGLSGDAPSPVTGELRLGFARRAGATRLVDSFQSGCLRARMPRTAADQDPCLVLINTGGGVTGGDRLRQSIDWESGSRACVATQAAEKVYRSSGQDVVIDTRLRVMGEAVAEWLPQETIIFDRARLKRTTEVALDGDASFLGLEMTVLGRAAMGETVSHASLRDRWKIFRDGRLVYADAQRLIGPVDQLMDRAAIGAGARAMGVLIHVALGATAALGAVRDAMAGARGRVAASAWNGLLVARFLAPEGQTLKHDVAPVLAALRGGRPLPRVWTC